MVDTAIMIESKKFMWDGTLYENEAQAEEKIASYQESGFETHLLEEDGKYLVYSRRVVTEIILEGGPQY